MPITFPTSPTVGQIETINGRVWQWTGDAWELYSPALAAIATSGSASDLTGFVPTATLPTATKDVPGIARIGENLNVAAGVVSAPDIILWYDNLNNFPATGQPNVLYKAKDTSRTYQWVGTFYVESGGSAAVTSYVNNAAVNLILWSNFR